MDWIHWINRIIQIQMTQKSVHLISNVNIHYTSNIYALNLYFI
jgi:hypothetical protein